MRPAMQRPLPFLLALTLALAAASSAPAMADTKEIPGLTERGRSAVDLPPRTSAGVWDGTWSYMYRDGRYAVWLRTVDGKPELRLQFLSTSSPEAFETDWDGRAVYYLAGQPATFEIKLTEADKDHLAGTWNWGVEFPDSSRHEKGTFEMYRSADGRQLVVNFHDLERVTRRGERKETFSAAPVWIFRKASKRLVLWDELGW
jgi:hypothetical protein